MYCPVCQDITEHAVLLESNASTHSLYGCAACNLKRLHPIPTEPIIQGLYKNQDRYDKKKAEYSFKSVCFYLDQIASVCPANPRRTVLDIGAGLGYYSNAFANKGMGTTCIEPDIVSAKFIAKNQNENITVSNKPVNQFFEECGGIKFDIIFCRHVIEHITDHALEFKNLKNICHENTVLIFETDNNDSTELLDHPEVKRYWARYYLKNYNIKSVDELKLKKVTALGIDNSHYFAFNKDNLQKLFKNLGFKTVQSHDYHLGDEYLWPNVPDYNNLSSYFRIPTYLLYLPQIFKYIQNGSGQGAGIISYLMLNE